MMYKKEQGLKDHYNKHPHGGTTVDNSLELLAVFQCAGIELTQNMKVLDLGCASGVMANVMHKSYDVDVTGVDSAFSRIIIGREKYPGIKLINQDIHQFVKTTPHRFDLITLFDILEHLEDPKTLIGHTKRLLNKDGVIISKTPLDFPYIAHLQVFKDKAHFDSLLNPDASTKYGKSIIAIWQ